LQQNPPRAGFFIFGDGMIYTAGTIAGNGNSITGTGTNFSAAGSLIRSGCTLIAFTGPVQVLQITAVTDGTTLAVTPAINPAIPAGTRYAILLSDSLSVDGLAQDIAETFGMYQRYMGGFADVMNGAGDVTFTINGVPVTVPGQKSLAKKGANSDITSLSGLTTALSVPQGGSGAKNAADARKNFDVYSKAEVDSIENYVPWNDPSVTALLTFDVTSGPTELLVRVTPTYCHIIGIIRKTMDSGNTSLFVVKAIPAGRAAVRTPHSVCFLTGGGVSSLLPTIVGTQSGGAGAVMRVSTVTTAALAAIVDMKIFFY